MYEFRSMQILLTAATKAEIELLDVLPASVDIVITGVGCPAAFYQLQKKLQQTKYDLVLQAGIAGSFNDKFLPGEVVIVRKLALSELLKMIFLHKPYNPKKVEIFRTTKLCISLKKKAYFQADGEYLGKKNHVKAEIISSQLSVMTAQEKEELALTPA